MSLRAEAYLRIRDLILRGELPFEEHRSERWIADQYGMSRPPVREALAVLTATGLVEQIPRVGTQVRRIDADEASEAVQLRLGMESTIVAEVAVVDTRWSDELEESVSSMRSASEDEDQVEFMLADTRLHVELARLGGFRTSLTGLQGFRDRVHLFRLQQPLTQRQMEEVIAEHDVLLRAVRAGNQADAVHAIGHHLEATRKRIEGAEAGEVKREPVLAGDVG